MRKQQYETKYGHIDWYKRNIWIRFKVYMKEIILNIWRKIGNKILFEFYTEIFIQDKLRLYEFAFPLVIKDEDVDHARLIITIIADDLKRVYNFRSVTFYEPQLVTDNKFIKQKVKKFFGGVKPNVVGEINFDIYRGKNIEPKNIGLITDDEKLINELGTYQLIDQQKINYKKIHQNDDTLPLETFLVKFFIIDENKPMPYLTPEEQLERIKHLASNKQNKQ